MCTVTPSSPSARIKPGAATLRAYRATRYEAAGVVVQVGTRSAAMDAVLGRWGVRRAAFIAPGNPYSRRQPDGWNTHRLVALRGMLRRVPHAPGLGQGVGWSEPHVLAALPPGRANVLARRFRQSAIVVVARGRPARLLFP